MQIVLLLSTLGIPDKVFLDITNESIASMLNMCKHGVISSNIRLSSPFKTMIEDMIQTGLHPKSEPFLNRVLKEIAKFNLSLIKAKGRVPLSKSGVMIGVADSTGTLEYGQIYCQIDYSNSRTVLTGNVVVTKNPCLYPSDIKVLKAVDLPELKHFVNVIVFPIMGKRPHPNEISGSDLDGDRYFIYWDQRIIPSKI